MEKIKGLFGKKNEPRDIQALLLVEKDPIKKRDLMIEDLEMKLQLEKDKNIILQDMQKVNESEIKKLTLARKKDEEEKLLLAGEVENWKKEANFLISSEHTLQIIL